jgi:hypothetical protein
MFALRILLTIISACCFITAIAPRVAAEEEPSLAALFKPIGFAKDRAEFSNGFDTTGKDWAAYASAVVALSGPIDQDGWRLKIAGLYGTYGYETRSAYCQLSAEEKKQLTGTNFSDICNSIANNPPQGPDRADLNQFLSSFGLSLREDQIEAVTPHQVVHYYGGIAPGYQKTLGLLILKAYLGLAFEEQTVTPPDPSKSLQGHYWGAQSWIEAWLPLGDDGWISADCSYFTGTSSYSAAVKLGYKPASWLTVGPELATYGDEDDVSGRAGAFFRFDTAGVETTLAGGVSGTYKDDPGAYGSANFFVRF